MGSERRQQAVSSGQWAANKCDFAAYRAVRLCLTDQLLFPLRLCLLSLGCSRMPFPL